MGADVGCPRCDWIPARVLCVAAPAGPNEIAQGDALGNRVRKVAALKGLNGQTGSAPGVQGLAQEVGRFLRKRRGEVRMGSALWCSNPGLIVVSGWIGFRREVSRSQVARDGDSKVGHGVSARANLALRFARLGSPARR
jgi:hypothetical protein